MSMLFFSVILLVVFALITYLNKRRKNKYIFKSTYIRQWSLNESQELRGHNTIDIRLFFSAMMFTISTFMNDKDSSEFVRDKVCGREDPDADIIAKLSSDYVLFIISCYTYAIIHHWIIKENKDKNLLLNLAGLFIVLFSKALDKDTKQTQDMFINTSTYYIKCISSSQNIFEIVSSDIIDSYKLEEHTFIVSTINILFTTWATVQMDNIINALKRYYEFNPIITTSNNRQTEITP